MTKSLVLQRVCEIYANQLKYSTIGTLYLLNKRGINLKTIERFQLGFAIGNIIFELASKEGWLSDAIQCGLITSRNTDYFEGCIVMPVTINGEYYNIAGRSLTSEEVPHKTLPNQPKDTLFNSDALKYNSIIIVESPLDAVTLEQNGFKTCAIMSLKIKDLTKELFKGKNCYILFDSDSSGKRGAVWLAKNLVGISKKTCILHFPEITQSKIDANSFFLLEKSAKQIIRNLAENSWEFSAPEFGKESKKIKKITHAGVYNDLDIKVVGKELFRGFDIRSKLNGLWIKCPHHKGGKEDKRSLWIGGDKNMFFCFGCSKGGKVIDLVSWHLGISEDEAKEWLDKNVIPFVS
jgi:DNA primase